METCITFSSKKYNVCYVAGGEKSREPAMARARGARRAEVPMLEAMQKCISLYLLSVITHRARDDCSQNSKVQSSVVVSPPYHIHNASFAQKIELHKDMPRSINTHTPPKM